MVISMYLCERFFFKVGNLLNICISLTYNVWWSQPMQYNLPLQWRCTVRIYLVLKPIQIYPVILGILCDIKNTQKRQKYTLLLDGGLVKGYQWRIWVRCNVFDVSSEMAFLSSQHHQSSLSTQFSHEWLCRKVVVKHSIHPNRY